MIVRMRKFDFGFWSTPEGFFEDGGR